MGPHAYLSRYSRSEFRPEALVTLTGGVHSRILLYYHTDGGALKNKCNGHQWYLLVFEPNVGKTLRETGIVSQSRPSSNRARLSTYYPWRSTFMTARVIVETEMDRLSKNTTTCEEVFDIISRKRNSSYEKYASNRDDADHHNILLSYRIFH